MYSFGPIYLMAFIDVVLTTWLLGNGAAETNPNVQLALNVFGGLGYMFIRLGLIGIVDMLRYNCMDSCNKDSAYNFLLWSHLALMAYWAVWSHTAGIL